MDLLLLASTSMVLGIILLCMGLSFLSQSLDYLDYNSYGSQWGTSTSEYYNNPLWRIKSKWFHYRPKGSIILSASKWAEIERNIGIKISDAEDTGKILGYNSAITEIQDRVREEQASIVGSNPYTVLGLQSTIPLNSVEDRYNDLIIMYDPKNFADLDKSFVELAEIRIEQIRKAWRQIKLGTFTA